MNADAVFVFICFIGLIPTESRQVDPTVFGDVKLNGGKEHYNRLLDNLVKVNTKRLESLQKTLNLGLAPVGLSPQLGSKADLRQREEYDDVLGLVIAVNDQDRNDRSKYQSSSHYPLSSSSSSDDETTSDSVEKEDDNDEFTPFQQMMLRKSWCKSCSKKAAKSCRKACKRAVRSGCPGHDCRHRVKKRIKRECKRKCRTEFDVSDDSRSY